MSHTDKFLPRPADSCFDLAETMLEHLKNKEYVEDNSADPENPYKRIILNNIVIPPEPRIKEKIIAAIALVGLVLNQQQSSASLLGKAGNGYYRDLPIAWFNSFDTDQIDLENSKKILKDFKNHLSKVPDPTLNFPRLLPPNEGAYWVGPFAKDKTILITSIVNCLFSFHNISPKTFPMSFDTTVSGEASKTFIRYDLQPMTAVLSAEGIAQSPATGR